MANQIDYSNMTPGMAVATTLEDILSTRRAEARQAMLDDINRRNVESEIGYRAENAKGLSEERSAMAEWRKSQAADAENKRSMQARRAAGMTQFMSSPEFGKLDPNVQSQFRIANQTGDDDLLRTIVSNMGKPPTRNGGYIFTNDEKGNVYNSGEWMEGVAGDQYHPHQFPPKEPVDRPQQYQRFEPDPTDPTKQVQVTYWLKPGEQPNDSNRIAGGNMFKGNPPPPHAVKPEVDTPEAIRFATLRGKASIPKSFFGTMGGPKPEDTAAFNQMRSTILSRFPPHVAQVAESILTDKSAEGRPLEEIVKAAVAAGYVKTEEADALSRLLTLLR